MNQFRLDGKRAVVTGGASGIGLAIAKQFALAGADVAVVDLRLEAAREAAIAVSSQQVKSSQHVEAFACDVADESRVKQTFEDIKAGGAVDILVNSAGIAHVGSILNTSAADFDRLYNVNVRGTFLCMSSAVRQMQQQQSGVILNFASIAATSGLSERLAYSMTKGAVLAMTLSVARDCLPFGIRCNCLSPARVHTPFVDGFVAREYPGREGEMMQTLAASQPIGRMGTPEEIASLALYLCSDAASFVTGSNFPIDGGFNTLR